MKKGKRYLIFYICDLTVLAFSIISIHVINSDKATGLRALEGAGKFMLYWALMWVSLILFVIVSIVKIVKCRKRK
ncbi:MAG TPA: hypothetical protein VHQ24_18060 [Lachnospiraceae bacterium]|nr:hypothetical protein [Lachnospiraceae bacterium]HEX3078764.1 hypothetical protein [Lachnospiraceae bacterium]